MRLKQYLTELAYPGNLGFQEMIKFYKKASKQDQTKMDKIVKNQDWKEFRKLIKKVLAINLTESKQSEPLKSIKMVDSKQNTKIISLSRLKDDTFEIVVDTETQAPTSIRGVKSNLVRNKFKDEESAIRAFNKKVSSAEKKGWRKK